MVLDNRKISILFSVIEEHVRTAEPVASQAISNTRSIDASSATIRNEMYALEEAGYLMQPYTSAGRVPTERAYRLYIEHLQSDQRVMRDDEVSAIHSATRDIDDNMRIVGKSIAHVLAGLTSEAIVIGFNRGDAYATGISYLVVQPEFQDQSVLHEFSMAVDRLDETLDALANLLDGSARVVLGSENPFGRQCGTVATHFALPEGDEITLGIVGPMRMAYDRNLGFMKIVEDAMTVV